MTKTKISTKTKVIVGIAFVSALALAIAGGVKYSTDLKTKETATAVSTATSKAGTNCSFTVKGQIKVQDLYFDPATVGTEHAIHPVAYAQIKVTGRSGVFADFTETTTTDLDGNFSITGKAPKTSDACKDGVYIKMEMLLESDRFLVKDSGLADTGILSSTWITLANYADVGKMTPGTWAFDETHEGVFETQFMQDYILFTTDYEIDDSEKNIFEPGGDLIDQDINNRVFTWVMLNKAADYFVSLGDRLALTDQVTVKVGSSLFVPDGLEISHANSVSESIFYNTDDFLNTDFIHFVIFHELSHVWLFHHSSFDADVVWDAMRSVSDGVHPYSEYKFAVFHEALADLLAAKIVENVFVEGNFYEEVYNIADGGGSSVYSFDDVLLYPSFNPYYPIYLWSRFALAVNLGEEEQYVTHGYEDNSEYGWQNIFNVTLDDKIYKVDFGTVDISSERVTAGDLSGISYEISNVEYPNCDDNGPTNVLSTLLNTCSSLNYDSETFACPRTYFSSIPTLEDLGEFYETGDLDKFCADTAPAPNCDIAAPWHISLPDFLSVFLSYPDRGYPDPINLDEMTLDGFLDRANGILDNLSDEQTEAIKDIVNVEEHLQPKDIMGCSYDFSVEDYIHSKR